MPVHMLLYSAKLLGFSNTVQFNVAVNHILSKLLGSEIMKKMSVKIDSNDMITY